MTPDLIRLAREAGFSFSNAKMGSVYVSELEQLDACLARFAELVAEECAKVAEDCGKPSKLAGTGGGYFMASGACIAQSIRGKFSGKG